MVTEILYNAHFEMSPAGHVAVARACGYGWWEEWVCVGDGEWRRFAELLLDGRVAARRGNRPLNDPPADRMRSSVRAASSAVSRM
jgi:hypothetical protein